MFENEKTLDSILAGMDDNMDPVETPDEDEVETPNPDPDPEVPTPDEDQKPEGDETPEETSEEDTPEEDKPEEEDPEKAKRKHNAEFAKIRIQNKKFKEAAEKAGFDNVDDWLASLDEAETKAEVEKKYEETIPQAVKDEIASLQNQVKQFEAQKAETAKQAQVARLQAGIDSLTDKYGLSEDQLRDFADQARQNGFNLAHEGTDMTRVYEYLNPQATQQKLEEEITQRILKQMKGNNAPKAPKPSENPAPVKLDLDKAIADADKYFKNR